MRFAVAILVVALFGAISANKALFKELSEINKHPFGATMLAAISTNLRAKTPLSDVSDLLNKILADLQADSATLDSSYADAKSRFAQAIENGNSLIATTQETIETLESAIESYETEGLARVEDFTTNTENLAATEADLEALNADFQTQTENHDLDVENLNGAIAACNQALDRMNTYRSASGAALLQVANSAKSHLTTFSSIMKEMAHKLSKHGSIYSPLIHELVQLTADVSDDKADQIVDLLNQLVDLLTQALYDLNAARASFVANYENHRDLDESNIAAYKAQIAFDLERVAELGSQSVQAHGQLDTANANLVDAQNLLAQNEAADEANEANYADQRPRYDNLIHILNRLIQHFNESTSQLDEWTANQINGEI